MFFAFKCGGLQWKPRRIKKSRKDPRCPHPRHVLFSALTASANRRHWHEHGRPQSVVHHMVCPAGHVLMLVRPKGKDREELDSRTPLVRYV